MKKDDIVTLTIDDIGTNGEGIGRTEGITLFIKDALPGDMVRAKIMKMKKTYGYARLMEILKESTMRTTPHARSISGVVAVRFRHFLMGASLSLRKIKYATT